MWLVAPDSMTHLKEDEIRHVFCLSDSASVEIGIDADFNDTCSKASLIDEI